MGWEGVHDETDHAYPKRAAVRIGNHGSIVDLDQHPSGRRNHAGGIPNWEPRTSGG